MAGGPSNLKEEMEVSELTVEEEEVTASSHLQGQEPQVTEILERGIRSLGVIHRRQKLDSKLPGSTASQQNWIVTVPKTKKWVSQLPRMLRDPGHGESYSQEGASSSLTVGYRSERRMETDRVVEIGPEELGGLELEVMRRQIQMITGRLRDLEEQSATWRQRDVLLVTMLVSACIANLWLWMRQ
ncbi:fetal and adult testis-expressed transcript protein [Sorex araneus]|uniref:fetal and adult testis-expressed transcript protein n=1 Tax=Sorex araneus TaxID=42254 RepID=UPI0003316536|nr:fetal and adult testis-expressed transcript protein [Sorex araneus]